MSVTVGYQSSFINQRNLDLGDGQDDEEVIQRVIDGVKPVGFATLFDKSAVMLWSEKLLEQEYPLQVIKSGKAWLLSTAQARRGYEIFGDLDMLKYDYEQALGPSYPDVLPFIDTELDRVSGRNLDVYIEFSKVEVGPDAWFETATLPGLAAYARCGLLLGYPIESTIKIIADGLAKRTT